MQMTNCGFKSIALIQQFFHFHFHFADAVRFIPMQLSFKFFAVIQKAIMCKTFQLAPTPTAILLLQPLEVTDITANGNDLDVLDLADDFKWTY
jgi:hypothetical protein